MGTSSYMIPRILIAGANSGCGKTTITCAILKVLTDKRFAVQSYKCGPDYIDPMLHTHITKIESRNLDPFFLDSKELEQIFIKDAKEAEIAVIEGVMGFYDGIAMTKNASTHSVAEATKTPVILVMNIKGMANTIIPILKGLKEYNFGDNQIKGVILNCCTKSLHDMLKPLIEEELGIMVCGYFPVDEKIVIKSRHLGLMTAQEIGNLDEIVEELGKVASETIDFEKIVMLAKSASVLEENIETPSEIIAVREELGDKEIKIAVAKDKAFCFYYRENLDILEQMGAKLCYFSPIKDKKLPDGISGIYLGGGYPEAYARELSENKKLQKEIVKAHNEGIPIIGECGGFMYLCKELTNLKGEVFPMSGLVDAKVFMTPKLNMQFGYVTATALEDTSFVKEGMKIRTHEFHYSKGEPAGELFEMEKVSGKKWHGVYGKDNLMAGYPHWYFRNCLPMVGNFMRTCKEASKIGKK
ncbi:MAG: cobyrinate a,c-diamide synthase [Lachnospiraceae bacterium]